MGNARAIGLVVAALALGGASVARAEGPTETLGVAWVFTNDTLGENADRWRTGALGVSLLRGPSWGGSLPTWPFALMEYRLRAEAVTPDDLTTPAPGDRLYAGMWWLGAHTHFDWRGLEVAAGADLVVTGEQTGIRSFQASLHDALSISPVGLRDYQIDNAAYLHGTVEIARSLRWQGGELRPFAELQVGVENMARAGMDVTLGQMGQGGLRLRDPVTGHRVDGIDGTGGGGWSWLLGADTAWVEDSVLLPGDRGFEPEEIRHRVRAGANYAFGQGSLFYGVAWLSEEFTAQPEGQMVGALSFDLRF